MGEEIAKRYANEAKAADDDPKYRFYVAKASEGAAPQIRRMSSLAPAGTNGDKPSGAHVPMLLLDLMDNGAFYAFEGKDITAETITGFIQAYEAKTLRRQQLQILLQSGLLLPRVMNICAVQSRDWIGLYSNL